jgi:hypothetical protein
METFGPRLARLPWHGARGAEKHLELSERKRIAQVRGLLDHAWLEAPIASLVEARSHANASLNVVAIFVIRTPLCA